ncbi:MAG: thioredoxin [Alphaproteobacteria bacterium]
MIFGSSKNQDATKQGVTGAPANRNDIIFDVGTHDFEQRVMSASMSVPVIVDFWAPWCGPCKQLMPTLEKVVSAAGGKVLLAKVNIEENQELAAALRVQSVPTVYGFFQGQPVDAFMGAQPEKKIREFVQKLVTISNNAQPDALDIPQALKDAANSLSQGDVQTAHGIYGAILQQDTLNAEAFAGLVRCFIEIGQLDEAQSIIDNAPEEITKKSAYAQACTALELARNADSKGDNAIDELEAKIKADENDHQARIDLAMALYGQGKRKEAVEALLQSIALDSQWNDQSARKELIKLMDAMGGSDPVTLMARRRLSSLLFA